jgi:prepilin-type N-terminal cleavage/methylation domain-containing protein
LNKRGFTVLEILIAVLIFALGALILAKMQVTSVKGSGFNKQAAVSTTLAQKKMEELKAMSYSAVTTDATGVTDTVAGVAYNTTWAVVESGTAPTRYKSVAVTVAWGTTSITINSIISEV